MPSSESDRPTFSRNVKKSDDRSSDIFTLRENVGRLIVENRLSFDNAQNHVTAFRPISEAARSWSDDNFNLGSSYFHVPLTTVRHLLSV